MIRKLSFCLLTTLLATAIQAQQLYLDMGKSISSFDYHNSEGVKLKNLTGGPQNIMGLGYRMPLFATSLHVSAGATYNSYQAEGSDGDYGNSYSWDATFVGTNLGIDYEFLEPGTRYNDRQGFSFCLKGQVAGEFLVHGMQRLNDDIINLKGVEQFDKPFLFLKGGVSANYYISKNLIVYLQYMGGRSILPQSSKNEENLAFITHNFSLGLFIAFVQNKRSK